MSIEALKNKDSVVATQSAFRRLFGLPRHDRVPDAKTIRKWFTDVRATGPFTKPAW